jgi:hypothetical protein
MRCSGGIVCRVQRVREWRQAGRQRLGLARRAHAALRSVAAAGEGLGMGDETVHDGCDTISMLMLLLLLALRCRGCAAGRGEGFARARRLAEAQRSSSTCCSGAGRGVLGGGGSDAGRLYLKGGWRSLGPLLLRRALNLKSIGLVGPLGLLWRACAQVPCEGSFRQQPGLSTGFSLSPPLLSPSLPLSRGAPGQGSAHGPALLRDHRALPCAARPGPANREQCTQARAPSLPPATSWTRRLLHARDAHAPPPPSAHRRRHARGGSQ